MSLETSRRTFLGRMAGAVAAPMVLAGCWRKEGQPQAAGPAPAPANLDDVEDAATFRPPLPVHEPTVRVRVMKVRGQSPPPLRIGSEGQWIRLTQPEAPDQTTALAGPISVAMEFAGWSITDSRGFRASVDGRLPVIIAAMDEAQQATISVEAIWTQSSDQKAKVRSYSGVLRLVAREDLQPAEPSAFDLINDIGVESYLPGVLAGELYSHWSLQTYAAQAVAARSFATTEAAVFAGRRHYDLTNTASSQMYLGDVALKQALDAVHETAGVVLAYENLLVSGYYSSCCGGAAASASDAIGSNPVNDAPPLQGRSGTDVCDDAPVYQWKVEQPIEVLTRRLIAFGQDRRIKDLTSLARLASIEPIVSNANGRPTRMRVVDERGVAVELSAENFRRAANHSGQGLNPPEKPLRSSHLRATFTKNAVLFDGLGFGHGVGLCQYGAQTLASTGFHHREIIKWYYPGAELVKAYRAM